MHKRTKTATTQAYQIITKHTQHRSKLIMYMITLLYKYILHNHSHTTKKT